MWSTNLSNFEPGIVGKNYVKIVYKIIILIWKKKAISDYVIILEILKLDCTNILIMKTM